VVEWRDRLVQPFQMVDEKAVLGKYWFKVFKAISSGGKRLGYDPASG
jgi:hypothetical protein